MWFGADIQHQIKESFGEPGSNLYVSLAFVVVLTIVGGFVLHDAITVYRSGRSGEQDRVSRLARWVQSVEIPGTMMHFRTANVRVSALFTVPLGLATGLLASTIAVGGFIGVPGMMYVLGAPGLVASATELVIAFVMGFGGTIKYALHGLVDIRLAMILLAGSLFGDPARRDRHDLRQAVRDQGRDGGDHAHRRGQPRPCHTRLSHRARPARLGAAHDGLAAARRALPSWSSRCAPAA